MKNRIIAIGETGDLHCYLNVEREEAIARYKEQHQVDEVPDSQIQEYTFGDQFWSYDVYANG